MYYLFKEKKICFFEFSVSAPKIVHKIGIHFYWVILINRKNKKYSTQFDTVFMFDRIGIII